MIKGDDLVPPVGIKTAIVGFYRCYSARRDGWGECLVVNNVI